MKEISRPCCSNRRNHLGAMVLIAASIVCPSLAVAVEGGGSNWAMGSTGFGAGVVPEPGFHFANLLWFMDISTNQDFTLGTNRVTSLDVELTINFLLPACSHAINRWEAHPRP